MAPTKTKDPLQLAADAKKTIKYYVKPLLDKDQPVEDDGQSQISKYSKSVISTKMKDGKKKINNYIVLKEIGKGSFGKVKLVYDTDDNNKPYAMKTVKKRRKLKGFMRLPPGAASS